MWWRSSHKARASAARLESNRWLREHCAAVRGNVLSIGSGDDADGEGGRYRDYFSAATSYTTSEVHPAGGADLVLDVQDMRSVADGAYQGIFCSGVLEHVEDFRRGMAEITRILQDSGTLLLGLPFRQAIHMPPRDYWRFTEHGIRLLLAGAYEIEALAAMDSSPPEFPSAYWVRARKR